MMKLSLTTLLLFAFTFAMQTIAQPLYLAPKGADSRLSSFENLHGVKGAGATTNAGAKGNAFETVLPGTHKTLLDVKGEGTLQRTWLTIDQNPRKLRSLRLQMYWDGAAKPAVDVPLGDFFCYNPQQPVAFESELFSSGEGRSFICYIPMPFKKGARVVLINEGSEVVKLFFDIDFVYEKLPAGALYFHAYWSRQMTAALGTDLTPLPAIKGSGRFLGMSVGLITDKSYGKSWWGEGEVKMFLDDDGVHPTIVGTGAEDYIGSAWGLGKFINRYQGCTVANDSLGQYNFYRWHIPDAIYFKNGIRVTLQQIGGWGKKEVIDLLKAGANIKPVTLDAPGKFYRLLDMKPTPDLSDPALPNGWVNFYRVDDYSMVSYFYFNQSFSVLPALAPLSTRIAKL